MSACSTISVTWHYNYDVRSIYQPYVDFSWIYTIIYPSDEVYRKIVNSRRQLANFSDMVLTNDSGLD